jgi:hypothetical protein
MIDAAFVAAGMAALVVAVVAALVLWRPWEGGSSAVPTRPTTAVPLDVDRGATSCSADTCGTTPITFTVRDVDPRTVRAKVTMPGGADYTDDRGFTPAGGGTATWTFTADDTALIGEYHVVFDDGGRQSAPETFSVEAVPGSFGLIQQVDAAIVAQDYQRARALDDSLARATDNDITTNYVYLWTRILADPSQLTGTSHVIDGAYLHFNGSSDSVYSVDVQCERWDFHGSTVTSRPRPDPPKNFSISNRPFDTESIRAQVVANCPATTPVPTTAPATPATTG